MSSGGQVNDEGYIRGKDWEIEITSARRAAAGIISHIGQVISGQPKVGDKAIAEVDMVRRHDIMRNHTATHLLHRRFMKCWVSMRGRQVRWSHRLISRFDFTHPEAMTPEQIERVEKMVNDAVAADMPVHKETKSLDEAKSEGAMAFFGEKYGETVRTLTIGEYRMINIPMNCVAARTWTERPMSARSSSSAKARRRQASAASKR